MANQNNTPEAIREFILRLAKLFPGDVSLEKAQSYYGALEPYLRNIDLQWLQIELLKNYKYFPAVKEIIDVVKAKRKSEWAIVQVRSINYSATKRWDEASPIPEEIKQSESWKRIFGRTHKGDA